MIKNILPAGQCIFVRQPEQKGLGHAVLCAERAVGNEPFAVLLADDFITYEGDGVTADLVQAFKLSQKSQLSILEISGPEISEYGVIVPNEKTGMVSALEKPKATEAPSNMASIGRYILTPDIFDILRFQPAGTCGEIQLSDAINIQAKKMLSSCEIKWARFDCGSVPGYLDAIKHVAEKENFKFSSKFYKIGVKSFSK